jgi:lipoprotein-anchoring transpeptidase ErfK/SrfK
VKAGVDVRKDPKPKGAHYVGASMPYFIRFNGAVGMHAGNVPDSPASHGCVRLPPRMARTFFKHVPIGSRVQVVP